MFRFLLTIRFYRYKFYINTLYVLIYILSVFINASRFLYVVRLALCSYLILNLLLNKETTEMAKNKSPSY